MVSTTLLFFASAVIVIVTGEELIQPPVVKTPVNKSPVVKPPVEIVAQDSSVDDQGGYKWSYASADGTKASEEGLLKDFGNDTKAEVAHGNFAYSDPADGKSYSVEYTADENGYQPKGDHLPVAPPIPPLIQRSLDYLATAPPPKEEKKI